MPRRRKTLEQHLMDLIEQFGIVRVKAAIDMMDHFIEWGGQKTTAIRTDNQREVKPGVKTEAS